MNLRSISPLPARGGTISYPDGDVFGEATTPRGRTGPAQGSPGVWGVFSGEMEPFQTVFSTPPYSPATFGSDKGRTRTICKASPSTNKISNKNNNLKQLRDMQVPSPPTTPMLVESLRRSPDGEFLTPSPEVTAFRPFITSTNGNNNTVLQVKDDPLVLSQQNTQPRDVLRDRGSLSTGTHVPVRDSSPESKKLTFDAATSVVDSIQRENALLREQYHLIRQPEFPTPKPAVDPTSDLVEQLQHENTTLRMLLHQARSTSKDTSNQPLEEDMNRLGKENNDLKLQLHELELAHNDLKKRNSDLQNELHDLQQSENTLQTRNAGLSERLNSLEELIRSLDADNVRQRLSEYESRRNDEMANLKSLSEALEESNNAARQYSIRASRCLEMLSNKTSSSLCSRYYYSWQKALILSKFRQLALRKDSWKMQSSRYRFSLSAVLSKLSRLGRIDQARVAYMNLLRFTKGQYLSHGNLMRMASRLTQAQDHAMHLEESQKHTLLRSIFFRKWSVRTVEGRRPLIRSKKISSAAAGIFLRGVIYSFIRQVYFHKLRRYLFLNNRVSKRGNDPGILAAKQHLIQLARKHSIRILAGVYFSCWKKFIASKHVSNTHQILLSAQNRFVEAAKQASDRFLLFVYFKKLMRSTLNLQPNLTIDADAVQAVTRKQFLKGLRIRIGNYALGTPAKLIALSLFYSKWVVFVSTKKQKRAAARTKSRQALAMISAQNGNRVGLLSIYYYYLRTFTAIRKLKATPVGRQTSTALLSVARNSSYAVLRSAYFFKWQIWSRKRPSKRTGKTLQLMSGLLKQTQRMVLLKYYSRLARYSTRRVSPAPMLESALNRSIAVSLLTATNIRLLGACYRKLLTWPVRRSVFTISNALNGSQRRNRALLDISRYQIANQLLSNSQRMAISRTFIKWMRFLLMVQVERGDLSIQIEKHKQLLLLQNRRSQVVQQLYRSTCGTLAARFFKKWVLLRQIRRIQSTSWRSFVSQNLASISSASHLLVASRYYRKWICYHAVVGSSGSKNELAARLLYSSTCRGIAGRYFRLLLKNSLRRRMRSNLSSQLCTASCLKLMMAYFYKLKQLSSASGHQYSITRSRYLTDRVSLLMIKKLYQQNCSILAKRYFDCLLCKVQTMKRRLLTNKLETVESLLQMSVRRKRERGDAHLKSTLLFRKTCESKARRCFLQLLFHCVNKNVIKSRSHLPIQSPASGQLQLLYRSSCDKIARGYFFKLGMNRTLSEANGRKVFYKKYLTHVMCRHVVGQVASRYFMKWWRSLLLANLRGSILAYHKARVAYVDQLSGSSSRLLLRRYFMRLCSKGSHMSGVSQPAISRLNRRLVSDILGRRTDTDLVRSKFNSLQRFANSKVSTRHTPETRSLKGRVIDLLHKRHQSDITKSAYVTLSQFAMKKKAGARSHKQKLSQLLEQMHILEVIRYSFSALRRYTRVSAPRSDRALKEYVAQLLYNKCYREELRLVFGRLMMNRSLKQAHRIALSDQIAPGDPYHEDDKMRRIIGQLLQRSQNVDCIRPIYNSWKKTVLKVVLTRSLKQKLSHHLFDSRNKRTLQLAYSALQNYASCQKGVRSLKKTVADMLFIRLMATRAHRAFARLLVFAARKKSARKTSTLLGINSNKALARTAYQKLHLNIDRKHRVRSGLSQLQQKTYRTYIKPYYSSFLKLLQFRRKRLAACILSSNNNIKKVASLFHSWRHYSEFRRTLNLGVMPLARKHFAFRLSVILDKKTAVKRLAADFQKWMQFTFLKRNRKVVHQKAVSRISRNLMVTCAKNAFERLRGYSTYKKEERNGNNHRHTSKLSSSFTLSLLTTLRIRYRYWKKWQKLVFRRASIRGMQKRSCAIMMGNNDFSQRMLFFHKWLYHIRELKSNRHTITATLSSAQTNSQQRLLATYWRMWLLKNQRYRSTANITALLTRKSQFYFLYSYWTKLLQYKNRVVTKNDSKEHLSEFLLSNNSTKRLSKIFGRWMYWQKSLRSKRICASLCGDRVEGVLIVSYFKKWMRWLSVKEIGKLTPEVSTSLKQAASTFGSIDAPLPLPPVFSPVGPESAAVSDALQSGFRHQAAGQCSSIRELLLFHRYFALLHSHAVRKKLLKHISITASRGCSLSTMVADQRLLSTYLLKWVLFTSIVTSTEEHNLKIAALKRSIGGLEKMIEKQHLAGRYLTWFAFVKMKHHKGVKKRLKLSRVTAVALLQKESASKAMVRRYYQKLAIHRYENLLKTLCSQFEIESGRMEARCLRSTRASKRDPSASFSSIGDDSLIFGKLAHSSSTLARPTDVTDPTPAVQSSKQAEDVDHFQLSSKGRKREERSQTPIPLGRSISSAAEQSQFGFGVRKVVSPVPSLEESVGRTESNQRTVNELRALISELQEQLSRQRSTSPTTTDIADKNLSLEKLLSQKTETVSSLKQDLDILQDRVESLKGVQSDLVRSQFVIQRLEESKTNDKNLIKSLEERVERNTDLEEENTALKKKLKEAQQNQRLSQTIEMDDSNSNQRPQHTEGSPSDAELLRRSDHLLAESQRESINLQQQLSLRDVTIDSLEEKLSELHDRQLDSTAELAFKSKIIKSVEEKLALLEEEVTFLRSENDSLRKQVQQQHQSSDSASLLAAIESLRRDNNSLTEELKNKDPEGETIDDNRVIILQDTVKELQAKLAQRESQPLHPAKESLRNLIEDSMDAVSQLRQLPESQEPHPSDLSSLLSSLKYDISQINQPKTTAATSDTHFLQSLQLMLAEGCDVTDLRNAIASQLDGGNRVQSPPQGDLQAMRTLCQHQQDLIKELKRLEVNQSDEGIDEIVTRLEKLSPAERSQEMRRLLANKETTFLQKQPLARVCDNSERSAAEVEKQSPGDRLSAIERLVRRNQVLEAELRRSYIGSLTPRHREKSSESGILFVESETDRYLTLSLEDRLSFLHNLIDRVELSHFDLSKTFKEQSPDRTPGTPTSPTSTLSQTPDQIVLLPEPDQVKVVRKLLRKTSVFEREVHRIHKEGSNTSATDISLVEAERLQKLNSSKRHESVRQLLSDNETLETELQRSYLRESSPEKVIDVPSEEAARIQSMNQKDRIAHLQYLISRSSVLRTELENVADTTIHPLEGGYQQGDLDYRKQVFKVAGEIEDLLQQALQLTNSTLSVGIGGAVREPDGNNQQLSELHNIIGELNHKIQNDVKVISSLQEQLSIRSASEAIEGELRSAVEELQVLHQQDVVHISELKQHLQSLREENDHLRNQLLQKGRTVTEEDGDADLLKQVIELRSHFERNTTLKGTNLSQQLTEMKEMLHELQSAHEYDQTRVRELEAKLIDGSNDDLKILQATHEYDQARIRDLETKLSDTSNDEQTNTELARKTSQLNDMQVILQQLRTNQEHDQARIHELEAKLQNTNNDKVHNDLSRKTRQLDELKDILQELQATNELNQSRIRELETQLRNNNSDKLNDDLKRKTRQLDEMQQIVEELKTAYQSEQQHGKGLEQRMTSMRIELSQQAKELDALQATDLQSKQRTEQLHELTSMMSVKDEMIASLKDDIEHYKCLSTLKSKNTSSDLNSSTDQFADLKSELISKTNALDELRPLISNLRSERDVMQQELDATRRRFREAQKSAAERSRIEGEKKVLEERLRTLEQGYTELQSLVIMRNRAKDDPPQLTSPASLTETDSEAEEDDIYLGLEVADTLHIDGPNNHLRASIKYDGVRVVSSRRPAAPAVRPGDVIISVCGMRTLELSEFRSAIRKCGKNNVISLIIRRLVSGDMRETTVEIRPRVRTDADDAIKGPRGVNSVLLYDRFGLGSGASVPAASGTGLIAKDATRPPTPPSVRGRKSLSPDRRVLPIRINPLSVFTTPSSPSPLRQRSRSPTMSTPCRRSLSSSSPTGRTLSLSSSPQTVRPDPVRKQLLPDTKIL